MKNTIMKKFLPIAISIYFFEFVCMGMYAQYTQTLPLNYEDFFRAEAIAEGGDSLERGEYASTSDAINANQWNRTGKNSDWAESNPSVVNSTLSYGSYIDNAKGKEIILANLPLNGTSNQVRSSIYSLQNSSTYTNAAYYLAALINITEATGKGDILAFDGNYTANAQRARLYVNKSGSGFCVGLGWGGDPAVWSDELAFGTTHLVVVKLTPLKNGNTEDNLETATLFLDPDISKVESENLALANVDGTADISGNKGIKSIRGITVRQRSKIAGSIAGLRFGTSWDDVVVSGEIETTERIVTDFSDTDFWGNAEANLNDAVSKTESINGFSFVNAGLLSTSAKSVNGRNLTNRIAIDKLSNGGMVVLPVLASADRITLYVQAGSEDKEIKLQCFDFSTNLWEDVVTYHFVDKVVHVFSTVLNRNEATRLRLVNADNSTKYIWRIETFPYVDLANLSTDFSDTEVWGVASGTSYSAGSFPSSTKSGFVMSQAGLVRKNATAPTGEYFTTRMEIDKKNNGGMVELPDVKGVARIDIYANVGGENPTINLDSFSYSIDNWVTIETITLESACKLISRNLNSTSTTRLRLANADGSAKFIWKIVTYPSMPTDLAVPAAQPATNVSSKAFSANWSAVAGATGYRVIVYNADRDSIILRKEVDAGVTTLPINSKLSPLSNYYYKVSAIGDGVTTVDSYLSEAVNVTTTADAATTEYYTRSVTAGNYGTICLPKACEDLSSSGGVFFAVAGKIMSGDVPIKLVFDEVDRLEAGKPYVFQATASEINLSLIGDAVDSPNNSGCNGLIGKFSVTSITPTKGYYILSNNMLYSAETQHYYVGENRAYFNLNSTSVYDPATAPSPAPGKRRAVMNVDGVDTATSDEGAKYQVPSTKAQKKLIDGRLVIERAGQKFDVLGNVY